VVCPVAIKRQEISAQALRDVQRFCGRDSVLPAYKIALIFRTDEAYVR
jgi:hypothetical protein